MESVDKDWNILLAATISIDFGVLQSTFIQKYKQNAFEELLTTVF